MLGVVYRLYIDMAKMEEGTPKRRKSICRYKSQVLAIAISFFLVAFFSIPVTIFYVYRSPENFDILHELADGIDICAKDSVDHLLGSKSCHALPIESKCYTHVSAIGNASAIIVHTELEKLVKIDELIMQIQNNPLIQQSVSQKCLVEGELPLEAYCRYLFPLCNEDGQLTRISQQQCESLRDNCSTEFNLVSLVRPEYTKYVPECSGTNGSRTNSFNTTVTCHPQFVNVCPSIFCVPSCTEAVFIQPELLEANLALTYLVPILTLIGGTLFLILALIRRKEIFTFPTVLVVYENFIEMLIGLIFLVSTIGGPNLFCSHPDALRTLTSPPTPSCSLSGFILHFGPIAVLGFWIVHFSYILIILKFPFFGRKRLKQRACFLHAITVPIVILIGAVGPVVVLAVSPYTVANFPPNYCLPGNLDAVFYSLILPTTVLLLIGCIMMVFLVQQLHKAYNAKVLRNSRRLKRRPGQQTESPLSTPEIKFILLSAVAVFFGVLVLAMFSFRVAIAGAEYESLIAYAKCQFSGHDPRCQYVTPYNRTVYTIFSVLSRTSLGLVSLVNLIFPLSPGDFKKAKSTIVRTWKKLKSFSSTSSSYSCN